MTRHIMGVAAFVMLAACSHAVRTDAELQSAAEKAVNTKLDAQGVFSLVESVASQDIACGHVKADVPAQGHVTRDFVYRSGRLILDDDPDFDQAALACDVAAGGGNASSGADDIH